MINKASLKYIFLTVFVIYFLFSGTYPTIPLLKTYIYAALSLVVMMFFLRRDLSDFVLLFFLLALFNKAGKIPLPMLPDLVPYRFVWMAIIVLFMFELIMNKREKILPITGIEVAMIVFSIFCVSSMFLSGSIYGEGEGVTLGFYLSGFGMPFTLFFLTKNIVAGEQRIKNYLLFFAIVGLYLGLTGIFERLHIHQLVFPSYITNVWKGVHAGRSRGPFMHAGVNGTVVGMIILMVVHFILREKVRSRKVFFIILIMIMLTTLIFTLTRGAWLAFFVGILTVAIFIPRVRSIFIPSCLILSIAVYSLFFSGLFKPAEFKSETEMLQKRASILEYVFRRGSDTTSLSGRKDLYLLNLAMFLERPLFGYGYGTYQDSKKEYISEMMTQHVSDDLFIQQRAGHHDTFVAILVELGLVGFGLLLYMAIFILISCKTLYNKLPGDAFIGKEFAIICLGIILIFLVKLQSTDMRYFIFPNCLYFSVAGIVVGLKQRITEKDKEREVLNENI